MAIKRSTGEKAFDVFNTCFMIFMIVITAYPMLYVVFAAFSTPSLFAAHQGLLLAPIQFNTMAMEEVFKSPNIITGYRNTLLVVSIGVVVNISMTILCAYVLSRKGFMWNKLLTLLIIFTMYFHGGLIPSYLVVTGVGLKNSFGALIIPGAISTFNMIIMRTGFAAIPESLEESAKLDGANHLTIMIRIMIPLAMPTIAVLLLYYGVNHWNSWFNALIYINDREKYPLQVFLREILIFSDTFEMTGSGDTSAEKAFLSETVKFATIIVATVPILCVYPFLQKYFTKGIMIGAVKG